MRERFAAELCIDGSQRCTIVQNTQSRRDPLRPRGSEQRHLLAASNVAPGQGRRTAACTLRQLDAGNLVNRFAPESN